MLISLIYTSIAIKDMHDEDLIDILTTARDHNARVGITGMLLFRNGIFLQVLEGSQEAVESLYEMITKDSRHHNVTLVHKGEIEKRKFSDWAMGFNHLSEEELSNFDDYTGELEAELFAAQPLRTKTLLESFHDRSYF